MIVKLIGTSGTGKSTIVRKIMAQANDWLPHHIERRKQPLYYTSEALGLAVPGHYETACGGCDTINKQEDIFNLVRQLADEGYNVLFEGLLTSGDVKRTHPLAQDYDVMVLALDVPIEWCLASINERRRRKKPEAPDVNPKNTVSKHKCVVRCMERLLDAGVNARWGTREEVEEIVISALASKDSLITQRNATE